MKNKFTKVLGIMIIVAMLLPTISVFADGTYSSQQEVTASVSSMPTNTLKGQASVYGNTRTNLIQGSNMDTDNNADGVADGFICGWHGGATSGNTVFSMDSAQKIDLNNPSSAASGSMYQEVSVASGDSVSFRVEAKSSGTGSGNFRIYIAWYNGGTFISEILANEATSAILNYTEYKSENNIAPANATKVRITLVASANGSSHWTVWFKNAMIEKASTVGNYILSGAKSTNVVAIKSTGKNLETVHNFV